MTCFINICGTHYFPTVRQQDVKSLMNSLNFTVSALASTLKDAGVEIFSPYSYYLYIEGHNLFNCILFSQLNCRTLNRWKRTDHWTVWSRLYSLINKTNNVTWVRHKHKITLQKIYSKLLLMYWSLHLLQYLLIFDHKIYLLAC